VCLEIDDCGAREVHYKTLKNLLIKFKSATEFVNIGLRDGHNLDCGTQFNEFVSVHLVENGSSKDLS